MPPPMTKCSICGQSVMKAQTYHVGNGQRACKTHEGVAQKKDELVQKTVEDQAWKEKMKQQKKEQKEGQRSLGNCCWACNRVALTEQEYYLKLMVAQERLKIKKIQVNPLTQEYFKAIRGELGLGDGKILFTTLFPVRNNEKLVSKLPLTAQDLVHFSNVVSLCQDCAANIGFKKEIPNMTIDDLCKFSAVYEVMVRPVTKQIAKKEISKEVVNN